MKKSIIAAGAASAVLAAMPVLGVFADQLTVKDQISITVSSSCTMDSINPVGATSDTGNTYTGSGAAGQLVETGGTNPITPTTSATTFTVKCNDADGYTLTPTFTSLKINGINGEANAVQDIPYASTSAAGSHSWTALYSKNSAAAVAFTASGTAINGSATMSDTFTFSYKVGLGADQAAGTYVGTATYVLANV